MQPILLCALTSALKARRWYSEGTLRIGSDLSRDICCPDPSISAEHAMVTVTDEGWFVFNESRHKGTLLNGARIGPQGCQLRRNDVVQCGKLALRVLDATPPLIQASSHVVKLQAVAKQSLESAQQRLAGAGEPATEQCQHLLTLFRTGYHLCRVDSPDELMQTVLDDAVSVLDAQRGSIILFDEVSHNLQLTKTAQRPTPIAPHFRKWYSRTLANRCFVRGESILCQDVRRDLKVDTQHSTLQESMSSIVCALLRTPRKKLGVLHLDRGPAQTPFSVDDFSLADAIAASVSAGIESAQLLVQQRDLFMYTVTALARAVEIRDKYTGHHTQRVTDYAMMLAEELGLSPEQRHIIGVGTPLHDIGKIGIADSILQKPGNLTSAEFEQMKTHALLGAELLADIPGLRPMLPIVRNHHEYWDGTGYPDRLRQQQIPRLARIVAVADAFDAMTSDRPYRRALSFSSAFYEIAKRQGGQFDPECVRAFLRLRPRIEAKRG
jgi:HD-GYP domain-containing protein (c-di-GMP phosphodiesterase class II)